MIAPENGTLRALGSRVENLRDFRGWSLEHLAERLGVDLVGLRAIEQGELDPPLSVLESIADCFEVPVSELLAGIDRL